MKNLDVKLKKGKMYSLLLERHQALDPLEIDYLEKSEEASKLKITNTVKHEDIVSKFREQLIKDARLPLQRPEYRIVRNAFDYAFPENFKQEPRSSLNYPISSAGADRSGVFHLGVGIGRPNVIIGNPPDFDLGDPADFYRHIVSAKIGHEFLIQSSDVEKNYTITSHVLVPRGIAGKL